MKDSNKMVLSTLMVTFALLPSTAVGMMFCSEPSPPYIPSGISASYSQMQSTQRQVESYLADVEEYSDCLREEVNDANEEAQDVIYEWERAVQQYNSR